MHRVKKWWQYSSWRFFLWAVTRDDSRQVTVQIHPGFLRWECHNFYGEDRTATIRQIEVFFQPPCLRIKAPSSLWRSYFDQVPDSLDELPF